MSQPGSLSNQLPPGNDELARRIADLERQVQALASARTAQATTVGGGGTTVTGGSIEVDDGSGNIICTIGTDPSGSGYVGLLTRRTDGTLMLLSAPVGFLGLQYTGLYDQPGNLLISDNPIGPGLNRPYMSLGQWVDYATPTVVTTSATFVTAQTCYAFRQHAKVFVSALVFSSSAGTTGELQLTDPVGTAVGGVVTIPANATTLVTLGPTAWPSWVYLDSGYFNLQIRRTAGTGNIGVTGTGFGGIGI